MCPECLGKVAPLQEERDLWQKRYDDLRHQYQPLEKDKLDAQREKHILREENERLKAEAMINGLANGTLVECIAKLEDQLRSDEQFCTWLCEDSNKYPGTDAGNGARSQRGSIRAALGKE